MTAQLITIPFSHYCEKARWALDHRGVVYREHGHLPFFSRIGSYGHGGGRSVPVLKDGAKVFADSTDIVRHADAVGTRGHPLLVGDDVCAWEERFDANLGPHARRVAYFALLQDDDVLRLLVRRASVPAVERWVGVPALPLFKSLLVRGLKITPEGAARSEQRVTEIFSAVEQALADGRRYLCGDTFTAADLTFAALAAPLLLPDRYAKTLIPEDALTPPLRAMVERWRDTAAGRFALRVYQSDR